MALDIGSGRALFLSLYIKLFLNVLSINFSVTSSVKLSRFSESTVFNCRYFAEMWRSSSALLEDISTRTVGRPYSRLANAYFADGGRESGSVLRHNLPVI